MSYYLKITMESGSDEGPYQTTEFTQNYSDHAQQITEMKGLFPEVAAVVGGKMVENGENKLKELTPTTSAKRTR